MNMKGSRFQYYLQNADKTYSLDGTRTVQRVGNQGDTAEVSQDDKIAIENYGYDELNSSNVSQITLSEDGLSLKLYYYRLQKDYTVNHYKQNSDLQDYTFAESETLEEIWGATVTGVYKDYDNYLAKTETVSEVVKADGSTVINLYY